MTTENSTTLPSDLHLTENSCPSVNIIVEKQQAAIPKIMDGTVAPSRPTLERLPAELRNRVYELVLEQDDEIVITVSHDKPGLLMQCDNAWPNVLALTQTSRGIRKECLPIFYEQNDFTFDLDISDNDGFSFLERYVVEERIDKLADCLKGINACTKHIGFLTVDLGTWDMQGNGASKFRDSAKDVAGIIANRTDYLEIPREKVDLMLDLTWAERPDPRGEMEDPSKLCEYESNQEPYGVVKLDISMHSCEYDCEVKHSIVGWRKGAFTGIHSAIDDARERLRAHPKHNGCYIHRRMRRLLEKLDDFEQDIRQLAEDWDADLM